MRTMIALLLLLLSGCASSLDPGSMTRHRAPGERGGRETLTCEESAQVQTTQDYTANLKASNLIPLRIEVRLASDQMPAVGVKVRAIDEGWRWYSGTSDSTGSFAIQVFGIPNGYWKWYAQAPPPPPVVKQPSTPGKFRADEPPHPVAPVQWVQLQPLVAVFPSDSGQGLRGILVLTPLTQPGG